MMRPVLLAGMLALLSTGCQPEFGVEFEPVTTLYDGIVLEPGQIELIEGQSIAFRVRATRNGNEKPNRDVRIVPIETSVFRAEETYVDKEDGRYVYAVIGQSAGVGEVVFRVGGKGHDVPVVVTVLPREDSISGRGSGSTSDR